MLAHGSSMGMYLGHNLSIHFETSIELFWVVQQPFRPQRACSLLGNAGEASTGAPEKRHSTTGPFIFYHRVRWVV